MDRRTFIKLATMASAVATCPVGTRSTLAQSDDEANLFVPTMGDEAEVALANTGPNASIDNIGQAIRKASLEATDFSWLKSGQSVFIKPVINSGNPYPATTEPNSVAAMIGLLRHKGAGRVIVGDMSGVEEVKLTQDNLSGSSRQLAKNSGLAEAVISAGGELHFFEEAGWNGFFADRPALDSHWQGGLMMPSILKTVDHIVLMPRCGRHILTGSTLGMKAAVGYWRNDTRLEYHRDAATLQEKTAEANTVGVLKSKLRLVVTTATKVLTTLGPDKGFVVEPKTGLIIASKSILAHDMVSLAWLMMNRDWTPESEKDLFDDPYTSQILVSLANRIVTSWLGGIGPALSAEKLIRNDLNTIWDDRVLRRAFDLWGGVPKINLAVPGQDIPEDILAQLIDRVTPKTIKA